MNDPLAFLGPRIRRHLQHPVVARALSFVTGMLAAALLFYFIYRVEVPSRPFIYVAF
ncbi:MAG: hypothetical protein SFV32_03070 [Opitutaceae bacterium]|nr:hypothetical protein [Opitutaceae bacterium]